MKDLAAPKAQTLLAVENVLRSSAWYSELLELKPLGTTVEETHGNTYNRLFHDNELILQLHSWDEEGHPNLVDRHKGPPGHGVLLWFEVADLDDAVERARRLDAIIVQDVATNPNSGDREVWLQDLDGYTVVLASST